MAAKLAALAAESAKPCQVCLDKDALIESLRVAVAEAQALAQTVSHHRSLDHDDLKKPSQPEALIAEPAKSTQSSVTQKNPIKASESLT